MTLKRFELKIPLDLLARIEEAARDYFQSPLNHKSKKPELTSPILKLIEKGLEKIASDPITDPNQIDTDKLYTLIDERIKAQLDIYELDNIRTKISSLEEVVYPDSQPVSKLDFTLITKPSSESSTYQDQTRPVSYTDRPQPDADEVGSKRTKISSHVVYPDSQPVSKLDFTLITKPSSESSTYQDLTTPVSYTDLSQPDADKVDSNPLESLGEADNPTDVSLSTNTIQTVSVDESTPYVPSQTVSVDESTPEATSQTVSVDESPPEATSQAESVDESTLDVPSQTESVFNTDKPTDPRAGEEEEKPKRLGGNVTLKGAWKHAQTQGFTGTQTEFRSLFKLSGDVHYGVSIVYLSSGSNSRNYVVIQ